MNVDVSSLNCDNNLSQDVHNMTLPIKTNRKVVPYGFTSKKEQVVSRLLIDIGILNLGIILFAFIAKAKPFKVNNVAQTIAPKAKESIKSIKNNKLFKQKMLNFGKNLKQKQKVLIKLQ